MKIKRIVNGEEIEFELTASELREAYSEQDLEYMMDDVRGHIESGSFEDEFEDAEDLTDEQIEEIARDAKRYLEDYDTFWDCYHGAIDDAIEDFIEEKEEN